MVSKHLLPAIFCAAFGLGAFAAEPVVVFDFTKGLHGWSGNPRIRALRATAEGMEFECTGDEDPWLEGPVAARMPVGFQVRLVVRMRFEGDTSGEIFFGPSFRGEDSVRFEIEPDGEWHDYRMLLPPQPEGTRLRIDPGHTGGKGCIARITALPLVPLTDPTFAKPEILPADGPSLVAGDLRVRLGEAWGTYAVDVAGREMARAAADGEIGVLLGGKPGKLDLTAVPGVARNEGAALVRALEVTDGDGVLWRLRREFRAVEGDVPRIRVRTTLRVARDREVYHLPWVTLFPGLGTFGERKTQAIVPGIEYLADEPSSSEADVRGLNANRRIADEVKFCYPMMALVRDDRYVGLTWSRADGPAAVFDSPDRTFASGAHLMGLWYPGLRHGRLENDFRIYEAMPVEGGREYTFEYTLIGRRGTSVVPAIRAYVAANGLPELPDVPGGFAAGTELMARGWLDSAANRDGRWRHAVWGDNFPAQPAADAAVHMAWLATRVKDADLAARLRAEVPKALAGLPDGNLDTGVSHVRFRALPFLVFGDVTGWVRGTEGGTRGDLGRFDAEGIIRYRKSGDRPDYGSTHFADHANGLAGPVLNNALYYACLSGKADIAEQALRLLDRQTELYADSVPRGAQTWEMPLHTPDILASGHLMSAYVRAFMITGDEKYLEQARYWAWTGVGMTYLDAPTGGPVGTYATTAVLGATNWAAPYWIGLPVQWCGLVYRSGLHALADVDPANAATWNQVASGITRAGLWMSWPASDAERVGLLPDFYHLRAQRSDGPAINPGTVGSHLPEAYGEGRIYDMKVAGAARVILHAPGTIRPDADAPQGEVRARVDGWPEAPYDVLAARLPGRPREITWNGKPVEFRYDAEHRFAAVKVSGRGDLRIVP